MNTVEKNENQIVFAAEVDESLINAVRRYVMRIGILAVDEVEIHRNDSPLYDETIAHRIGLIPLKMEKGFDEKTEVPLKLVVKKEGAVYSGELKGKAKIVYDNIPITLLDKGQEIEMVATAKVGRGSEHSKFSPGFIFYRDISEINLDKEFADEVKRICAKNEIKVKGDKVVVLDNQKKEVADVCEGISEKAGKKAEIVPTNEKMILVESFGQVDTKDVLNLAVKELKKDLAEVGKKVK